MNKMLQFKNSDYKDAIQYLEFNPYNQNEVVIDNKDLLKEFFNE